MNLQVVNSVRIAWRNLLQNKTRSLLTLLGMIIGVGAVIAIVSLGEGLKASFIGEVGSFGNTSLYIVPRAPTQRGQAYFAGKVELFKRADAEALARESEHISYVFPGLNRGVTLKYANRTMKVTAEGVLPDYFYGPLTELDEGRAFNEAEEKGASRVAVIGYDVRKDLIPAFEEPLGKTVKVGDQSFTVVGTLKQKGSAGAGTSSDKSIYVPLSTMQQRIAGSNDIEYIVALAKDVTVVEAAKDEVRLVMRKRRRVTDPSRDNFEIYSVEDWIGFVKQFLNALVMVFGFVAAIALLVGGIGIMNIMLVTVTERTREIGLRMALGANRVAVLSQFLVEAVVLTLVGGAIGLLFGWGIGIGVGVWLARLMKMSFTAHVPVHIILITIGVSVVLGVVFGVFPAFRASQLDPVRAMRYD